MTRLEACNNGRHCLDLPYDLASPPRFPLAMAFSGGIMPALATHMDYR